MQMHGGFAETVKVFVGPVWTTSSSLACGCSRSFFLDKRLAKIWHFS